MRILLFLCSILAADEFIVNLRNPEYSDGIISTKEGGVITSAELRLQAREITYVNRGNEQRVEAEGDLMIDNGRRVFVGRKLVYNFADKTGIVYDGRTKIDVWFIGGETIELAPNKTFYIHNAFVTTSENVDREWEVRSRNITITPDNMLKSEKITVRAFDYPVFYLPSYSSQLKKVDEPPVRYGIKWETAMNPRLSMRYRVYSWDNADLFWRLDYRLKEGPGTALEASYERPGRVFKTQNYLARDVFLFDDDPKKERTRFRVRGLYDGKNANEKTTLHMSWDKYSDKNMPRNFATEDFELDPVGRTQILLRHTDDRFITGLNFRPRVNSFQGFKQELPMTELSIHPFQIGRSKIISQNRIKAGYLDYVSADDIQRFLPDFSSSRAQITSSLYRPIAHKGFSITPMAGFIGIAYNNSPNDSSVAQAILTYELDIKYRLGRSYTTYRHFITPYAHYYGLTSPTTKVDSYFVFGIADGFNRLNSVKLGIQNDLYNSLFVPNFTADLYTYAFFGDATFSKTFPKAYLDLTWHYPSVTLWSKLGWNIQQNSLDKSNFAALWTINEDVAIYAEFRHRGPYDWRKNQEYNFILDVSRNIEALRETPLSDNRNTVLTRFQLKLAPQWQAQFEGHFGWGRDIKFTNYTAFKLHLITMIATSWQFKLSIGRTPRGVEFSSAFDLLKKPLKNIL